jgi:hypothetical protein
MKEILETLAFYMAKHNENSCKLPSRSFFLGVFLGVKSFASSNIPTWIISAAESLARLASED